MLCYVNKVSYKTVVLLCRYKQVIKVCALEKDLIMLPHGDDTVLDNNVSNHLKARINLARAIYKSADIYLLDNPFDKMEREVAKKIWDDCLTEFLQDKVTVLVTSQVELLRRRPNNVLLLVNGKLEAQGSFQELARTTKFREIREEIEVVDRLRVEEVSIYLDLSIEL